MSELPFLQHDPLWARQVIWDRTAVVRLAVSELGRTRADAEALLADYDADGGNCMEHEGCQICCLAMILDILGERDWTPSRVLRDARDGLWLSKPGLALTPFYADFCVDASDGRVQLCAHENYAAAGKRSAQRRLTTSSLVRAWRSLDADERQDFVVMLRIGTHDETEHVHYLLIDPADAGPQDAPTVQVLDPDMPSGENRGAWTFDQAWANFAGDRRRKLGKVRAGDIAAVFVFARWRDPNRPLLGALGRAIARL